MSAGKWVLGLVATAALGFTAYYMVKNPEKETLSQTARDAAGGKYVTLSQGVTHYDISGPAEGEPVVLVHGFSVPYYIWDSTAAFLSGAGYRVIRYDVYGRGMSDRPDTRYTADLFDHQLTELLDSLGLRGPVHLMGLSRGGPIVATFGGRHPERIRTLTLVDPASAKGSLPPGKYTLPVVGAMLWQSTQVPGMADGQLGDFVEPARWPGWPDKYRPQMRYKGFGRALLSTRVEDASVDFDSVYAVVGKQSFPVAMVWGREDPVVPFTYSDSLRRDIPRAELFAIDRAGHLPHMERTDTVNPLLLGFLKAHGAM